MTAVWPVSLPQSALLRGCVRLQDSAFIETKTKQGPPRRRRINTRPRKRFNLTIGPLNEDQLQAFDSFYDNDVDGGKSEFDWTHPLYRTAITAQFGTGSPQVVPIAGGGVSVQSEVMVSFILEIVDP